MVKKLVPWKFSLVACLGVLVTGKAEALQGI